MANETTKAIQCPACNGRLSFDPVTGKLKCEFCDSEYDPKSFEMPEEEKPSGDMQALRCSTCGADLITSGTEASTRCPYCGNNTIIPGQFTGTYRPDYVIPFAFTKEQAKQKYLEYYQKRFLLPKSFLNSNEIEEIQGIYVPFWLWSGSAGIDARYHCKDETKTETEIIIKYFDVRRQGSIAFEHVPADASQRMEDDLMDSIEPYQFKNLKAFSSVYLPGFLAERYDVQESEDRKRAENRIRQTIQEQTRATIQHEQIEPVSEQIQLSFDQTQQALLPVWYLVTKWNGKTWKFAMNGQTGKFIGDLPIDTGKFALVGILIFVLSLILGYVIISLFDPDSAGLYGLIAAAVITSIWGMSAKASMKPVELKSEAHEYTKPLQLTIRTEQQTKTEHKPRSQNQG